MVLPTLPWPVRLSVRPEPWILPGQGSLQGTLPKLQSLEVLVGKDLGDGPVQPPFLIKKSVNFEAPWRLSRWSV